MVLTLKKNASKEEIDSLRKKMGKLHKSAGVNTKKYCGTVKLKEDPLLIQKKLRNEWE